MVTIKKFYPNWEDLVIHESSPGNRGASTRLRDRCRQYMPSQYFSECAPGEIVGGVRCENIERLTFADESIDIHVTQDVVEHLLHPEKAFQEIARTLKPGGAHIFTVPLVNGLATSRARASMRADGSIEHMLPPIYHGNPISDQGALVTVDWGFDICAHIFQACGLFTQVLYIDDISRGIRADFIEVLVTIKPKVQLAPLQRS